MLESTKLRGWLTHPGDGMGWDGMGWDVMQRDMDKFMKRAQVNLTRFSKAKCRVLCLDQCNAQFQHRLGDEETKSSPAEKDLGVLGTVMDVSWQ
ncbi:hypothetical protein TURU_156832 [Turdus rufiventris]|nr:hypothetical protein TURU_156832 [Turdus rufiventris]